MDGEFRPVVQADSHRLLPVYLIVLYFK